jgi:hypothetical protein
MAPRIQGSTWSLGPISTFLVGSQALGITRDTDGTASSAIFRGCGGSVKFHQGSDLFTQDLGPFGRSAGFGAAASGLAVPVELHING